MKSFHQFLGEAIGPQRASVVISALGEEAAVSVRVNPHKWKDADPRSVECHFGVPAVGVPWCKEGYTLQSRPSFTLDPYLHGGAYYVQDSSSMFVGEVFRHLLEWYLSERECVGVVKVLDLCASPGGKTTHMASILRSLLGDRFILVSNEVMRQRSKILSDNISIWGDPCIVLTCSDPSSFACLTSFFDIILVDAPCSGEGMFRKDPVAREEWSEEVVAMCAARQKRILSDVFPALAPGGMLLYSTCTFNLEENERNVSWMEDELGLEVVDMEKVGASVSLWEASGVMLSDKGFRLAPGFVNGEGQFCCALRSVGNSFMPTSPGQKSYRKNVKSSDASRQLPPKELSSRLSSLFTVPMTFSVRKDMIVACPEFLSVYMDALSPLHPLRSGVSVGVMKGKDFVPDADLSLCYHLKEGAFMECEIGKGEALRFLHRDPIVLKDSPAGYILLRYGDVRLGFVKNLVSRTNSLHPMERRIRMDLPPSI